MPALAPRRPRFPGISRLPASFVFITDGVVGEDAAELSRERRRLAARVSV